MRREMASIQDSIKYNCHILDFILMNVWYIPFKFKEQIK